MRKILASVLGLSLVAVLAYGVIGSGATFTSSAWATQTITVGSMTLQLATDNGTLNPDGTVTCPAVTVLTATGVGQACHVTVSVVGGITPSMVLITPTQSGANEPAKFSVFNAAGSNFPLDPPGHQWVYIPPAQTLPIAESFHVEWTDLGNASMGNVITLTFTITASQF